MCFRSLHGELLPLWKITLTTTCNCPYFYFCFFACQLWCKCPHFLSCSAWKQSLSLLSPSSSSHCLSGSNLVWLGLPIGHTAPAAKHKWCDGWHIFCTHTHAQCLTSQKVIVLMNLGGSPPPKVLRTLSAQKALSPIRVNSVSASLSPNNGSHQAERERRGAKRTDNENKLWQRKSGKKIKEEKDAVDR